MSKLPKLLACVFVALCVALGAARPAVAVLIDAVDGAGNTSAPQDDPGWDWVGVRGGTTAVYLGLGWVLTANHVKLGEVQLLGAVWPAVPGSKIRLAPDAGEAYAPDLAVFRIDPYPTALSLLPIRVQAPVADEPAVLIGRGKNRGPEIEWDPGEGPVGGYDWAFGKTMRWGTNTVASLHPDFELGPTTTDSFALDFSDGVGPDESMATNGDSGGAVFLPDGADWALGGIIFSIGTYTSQPASTSLYGNLTYAADLSVYRNQILDLTRTECSNEIDDDGDLSVDYPNDPECTGVEDTSEEIDCDDGFDNDGDGLVDFPEDPGCSDDLDGSERSPSLVCDDGDDNDGDNGRDYPGDPGCRGASWHTESPQCNDGTDNDGDQLTDLEDPDCTYAWQNAETPPPTCGLGPELAPILLVLLAVHKRRRAA